MSLSKAFTILEVMSQPPYEFRIGDLCERTGLNRTTVYRIAKDLAKKDYLLYSTATKMYRIGPGLHHIGATYVNSFRWGKKVEETLEAVADATKESVGFAVREGDKVISLYEFETHQPFRMNYRPGTFYPMNRGCYGKCLMAYHDRERVQQLLRTQKFEKLLPNTLVEPAEILAEYDRIVEQGYVTSVGETSSPAAIGVGVPVFTRAGEVKGCMVVAFIKTPDWQERIKSHLQVLQEHAERLGHFIP